MRFTGNPMHAKIFIAFVALTVGIVCGILGARETEPSMKPFIEWIEAFCFLVCYLIFREWRNSHLKKVPKANSQLLVFYLPIIRVFGWIFTLGGIVMFFFAISQFFGANLQRDKSGDWEGLAMSLLSIAIGSISITTSKAKL